MANEIKSVICENCDSEYIVKFKKETVNGCPAFCTFCGIEIDIDDEDETGFNTDEDDAQSDDDY